MKSYTLNILWTGLTDATPHQRKRVVEVEVPVEGDTTAIEDALLSLPWGDGNHGESWTVRLVEPRASLDIPGMVDDAVLAVAIPQARAEMETKMRKDAEREEAEHTERISVLEEFAAGGEDPGYPVTEHVADAGLRRLGQSARDVLLDTDLLPRVEARLVELNTELGVEIVRNEEDRQAKREKLRAEQEARDAAKREKDFARTSEIAAWAVEHGSARLLEQIGVGLDGWPLYLHERLDADFGSDAELDNDGTDGDEVINPTEVQLAIAQQIAVRAVELGLCEVVAFRQIEIVQIEFERDDDDHGCDPNRKVYVTFSGYRPGSDAFELKTIRFCCEE